MPSVVNAADRGEVRRAGRLDKRRLERYLGHVREVMSLPAGRGMMWRRLSPIYRTSFDQDPHRHAYNTGRQDEARELQRELMVAAPELYVLMETEQRALAAREEAEIEAGRVDQSEKE